MRIATEGSLARGEYDSFMNFAKQQGQLSEVRAFSFYGRARKVELVAKTEAAVKDRLTKEITCWDHRAEELRLQEQAGAMSQKQYQERRGTLEQTQAQLQQRQQSMAQERVRLQQRQKVLDGEMNQIREREQLMQQEQARLQE